jgi:hypothetical protein
MRAGNGLRLAGLVFAVLGLFTYGTCSPFGLLLSAEKLREPDRPRGLLVCDWAGVVLSVPGCLFLPLFLGFAWGYFLIGPAPVLAYLAFLLGWTWYRVRVVCPRAR